MDVPTRLAKWLIFSVVLALMPIAFNYLQGLTLNSGVTLRTLLARGDLLLIACGLSAAAVGSLIGGSKKLLLLKLIAGGGSVAVLTLASLYFGGITNPPPNVPVDPDVVSNTSLAFFVMAIITSGSCVALEEV